VLHSDRDWEFESAFLQRGVSNEPCGCGGVARGWDPEFESALLQRGVCCELDTLDQGGIWRAIADRRLSGAGRRHRVNARCLDGVDGSCRRSAIS